MSEIDRVFEHLEKTKTGCLRNACILLGLLMPLRWCFGV